jgi:hypothetical protein
MQRFASMVPGILGAWCFSTALLHGQGWPPGTTIKFASTNIQTLGGITYLTFSARVVGCGEIVWAVETPTQTNLVMALYNNGAPFPSPCYLDQCFDCPIPTNTQMSTVVLGRLPAGAYTLWAYEWSPNTAPFQTVFFGSFTIPESSGPGLTASRGAGGIQLQWNGVTPAKYTLEASSNLVEWTPVVESTAPNFSFATNTALSRQYFRLAVTNGTVVLP